jgi:hypothetical protein
VRETAVVSPKDLAVSEDVSRAAWIGPRLGGEFGAVGRTVPRGYAAYARICHPTAERDGRRTKWSEVGAATGRRAHRLMQWHSLVGSSDPVNIAGSIWPGTNPHRGNLEPDVLIALCELLGVHTAAPEDCCFCLWEGYGWLDDREPAPLFTAEELSRPRVKLPHRSYLLLTGALPAASQIISPPFRQSPNLFWPADRAWCAATELDFDSTLVAGTAELIETILKSPSFDAWPVHPNDSLAANADTLNQSA